MFRGFDSGAVYKMGVFDIFGAPGGIRTHGPRIRNPFRGVTSSHLSLYQLEIARLPSPTPHLRLPQFSWCWTLDGHLEWTLRPHRYTEEF